ncbi:hypothetical protein T552_02264 [Pneumocystis carinii B80]|uniref:Protein-tyrosine phosphatase n=1 Tax=Pneumocystis carinii (strain B80) TaxID=1408658 RepID=A0A0W4ZFY0_PNEC8|nr:hypothetical protein T552_02264 [Pneumocystis carinii B80]KTW27281.1 hypothetical protein T552_02264 [Pneumocystis carinii B80]
MKTSFDSFLDLSYDDLHEKFIQLQLLEKQRKKSLSPEWSITESQKRKNIPRNRYTDIVPYNKSRVKLVNEENDYINASYIFLSNDKKYIASQGPLESTIFHFWNMVWNNLEDQGIILMLTKIEEQGLEKCAKYWPEEDKELILPEIFLKVEFIGKEYNEKAETLIHHLKLSTLNKPALSKYINHFYFKSWPDHGIPQNLLPFINLISLITLMKKKNDYIIVHCSAGCGRTGTYIVLDYLISTLPTLKENFNENTNEDPIFNIVNQIKQQRMYMVQSFSQFEFIYKTVKYFLKTLES